jgi:predicted TIM-barrel fold metal-dependent hydrolase
MIWSDLKDGTYYNTTRFDPVFAMAQKLDVPLYLHPDALSASIASKLFVGNYPAAVAGQPGTNS